MVTEADLSGNPAPNTRSDSRNPAATRAPHVAPAKPPAPARSSGSSSAANEHRMRARYLPALAHASRVETPKQVQETYGKSSTGQRPAKRKVGEKEPEYIAGTPDEPPYVDPSLDAGFWSCRHGSFQRAANRPGGKLDTFQPLKNHADIERDAANKRKVLGWKLGLCEDECPNLCFGIFGSKWRCSHANDPNKCDFRHRISQTTLDAIVRKRGRNKKFIRWLLANYRRNTPEELREDLRVPDCKAAWALIPSRVPSASTFAVATQAGSSRSFSLPHKNRSELRNHPHQPQATSTRKSAATFAGFVARRSSALTAASPLGEPEQEYTHPRVNPAQGSVSAAGSSAPAPTSAVDPTVESPAALQAPTSTPATQQSSGLPSMSSTGVDWDLLERMLEDEIKKDQEVPDRESSSRKWKREDDHHHDR